MANLKELQHAKGCTLLVTIHQPSPGVYRLFDGLVLLHRGALCYFGPGRDAPCTFLEQQVRQSRVASVPAPRRSSARADDAGWRRDSRTSRVSTSRSSSSRRWPRAPAALGHWLWISTRTPRPRRCTISPPTMPHRRCARSSIRPWRTCALQTQSTSPSQPGACSVEQPRASSEAPHRRSAQETFTPTQFGRRLCALRAPTRCGVLLIDVCTQLLLIRWRGISRYPAPLFIFSRVTLFASLAALFASFFYSQVRSCPPAPASRTTTKGRRARSAWT